MVDIIAIVSNSYSATPSSIAKIGAKKTPLIDAIETIRNENNTIIKTIVGGSITDTNITY